MMGLFNKLKCPECGASFEETARYCPSCGIDLEAPLEKDPALARECFMDAQSKYEANEKLAEALSDCDLAIGYDTEFAEAHNLRGLILDAMGRTSEAIDAYHEALRLNPQLKDALANLRDAEAERSGMPQYEFGREQTTDLDEDSSGLGKALLVGVIGMVVLMVLAGGGWLAYKFVAPSLTPRTEVVFIPDVPNGVAVKQADFNLAAQILTERSALLGYTEVTFEVSDMGDLVGKIPMSMDANELAGQIGGMGLLEFVDFGETPVTPGTVIRTDVENRYLEQVDGQIWHTVMTNDGIESANTSLGYQNNIYQVNFSLTEEGTQIFFEHTSQNIGTYLGIVLDKVVISAPIINDGISGGQGSITGNFTQKEAQELAVILQTKPLPFPVRLVEDSQ